MSVAPARVTLLVVAQTIQSAPSLLQNAFPMVAQMVSVCGPWPLPRLPHPFSRKVVSDIVGARRLRATVGVFTTTFIERTAPARSGAP